MPCLLFPWSYWSHWSPLLATTIQSHMSKGRILLPAHFGVSSNSRRCLRIHYSNEYIYKIYICVPVWIYVHLYMKVPVEARRGCQILWKWHYTWLKAAQCGCWEPNPGPLEEQQVLLTAKASLQPWYALYFIQCNWGHTILGTTHSTGVTAGRFCISGVFYGAVSGAWVLAASFHSAHTLWIRTVNTL